METTNPASRLHALLSEAKAQQVRGSGQAINLWRIVFRLPEDGSEEKTLTRVISGLLQLQKLINETEASLLSIEGLHERHFRPFGRIKEVPRVSLLALHQDVSPTLNQVTEGDLTTLEFCAVALESMHIESDTDESELQDILTEVNALFDDVMQSNIDPDLQTFILDGLEAIRRGIYEFRIRGSERLKEAMGEIVGDYWVRHPKPQSEEDEKSWERFSKSVGRFIAVVKFAHGSAKAIQDFVGPLLLGPSHTSN